MKLISCHIENFGKISKFDINFSDELTCIYEKNGEGKTTLAAYIKAMLYGLDTSKKNDKTFGDRLHYYPFSGGKFGGNIELESGGKTYRIERYFDRVSAAKDSLKFIDLKTQQEIKLSKEVGEFLLNIDKDAFEKTLFINSLTLETKATESINSKLYNFLYSGDQDVDFEENKKILNDKLKEYDSPRTLKKGKKQELNNKLITLQNQEQALLNIKTSMDDLYNQLEENNKSKNELEKRIKVQQEKNIQEKIWENFRTYQKDIKDMEEVNSNIRNKYIYGIPTDQEISSIINTINDYNYLKTQDDTFVFDKQYGEYIEEFKKEYPTVLSEEELLNLYSLKEKYSKSTTILETYQVFKNDEVLSELERKYSYKLPTKEELDNIDNKIEELNRLNIEKENLDKEYSLEKINSYKREFLNDILPSTSEIQNLKDKVEKYNKIIDDINKYNELAAENKNQNNSLKIIFIIIGILMSVFMIAGIVSLLFDKSILGIIFLIVGLVGFASSIIFLAKKENKTIDNKEKFKLLEDKKQIENQLRNIFTQYVISGDDFSSNLQKLQMDVDNYSAYLEKAKKVNLNNISSLENELNKFFLNYEIYEPSFNKAKNILNEEINNFSNLEKQKVEFNKEKEEHFTKIKAISNGIQSILKILNLTFDGTLSQIEKIYNDHQKYIEILPKLVKYQNLKKKLAEEIKAKNKIMDEFKKKYHEEDLVSFIDDLKDNLLLMKQNNANLEKKIKEAETFKNKYQLTENEEDVKEDIEDLQEQFKDINIAINKLKEDIKTKEEELSSLEDIKDEIQRTKEELIIVNHRIEIINKTLNYLLEAEQSLKNRYVKPIIDSYSSYANNFEELAKNNVSMDFNFNILFDIEGEKRNYQHFSQGYLSLIEVALRFALINNMYKEENPVIIMDDPFVYLDQNNLDKAKNIIKELAKRNQILYFCCHESRKI